MFINFWYAAATSDAVGDKPIKVKMLGQSFVVFRDSAGQAHCLSNVCAHRGGSLGHGKSKGDCVECPYHGWRYNGAGECTHIPSLGADAKIPSRTRIDSYPVQEKYGLIFAFLGDLPEAERPPLQEIPEWEQEGWRYTTQSRQRKVNFQRAIENGLDPAHNAFVHDTHISTANFDGEKVGPLDVKETPWGVGFWNRAFSPPLAEGRMREASGRNAPALIDVGTGHHGPCNLWTFIHPTPKVSIHQYGYQTPVDENYTRAFLVTMRNFLIEPEHDQRMIDRNFYVAFQDDAVLAQVEPVNSPRHNTHEVFMPADGPTARYREFCREWEARGWRVDSAKVDATQRHTAYAIPSPARRSTKGWVIDPVPLVEPREPAKAAAE